MLATVIVGEKIILWGREERERGMGKRRKSESECASVCEINVKKCEKKKKNRFDFFWHFRSFQ